MKVGNPNVKSSGVQASTSQAVEGKKSAKSEQLKGKAAFASETSAKVNLSDRAQAMSKAKAIASEDSVDDAKVARFQALIDSGKYKVDADKVADRLLEEHLNLGE